jgi:MFS family permease
MDERCPTGASYQWTGRFHHEWNADVDLLEQVHRHQLSCCTAFKTNRSRYFDYPTGAKLGIFNGTQGLGGVASQFFLWWLVEKIGRKYTIIIGSVIIIIGVFLQTFANGLVMFAVARAIIGLGLSFEYTAAPMLVAELAHPTHRAQLSTFLNTLYNFGATIAAWICLGTLTIQSDWSWRSVSLIQIFPSLISVALTWWVPESPSKLISSPGSREHIYAMPLLIRPTQDGLSPKVATRKHSISCALTTAVVMRTTN